MAEGVYLVLQPQHLLNRCIDARHLIEIRRSGSKGFGIFAKANIRRGTRILAESPLLKTKPAQPSSGDIMWAFQQLPTPQRNAFLRLHEFASPTLRKDVAEEVGQSWDSLPEIYKQVLSIHAINNIDSVYLHGSRFNHSCIPNVDYTFNSNIQKQTFHAVRDIVAGEELNIMYIDGVNRTRDQRQEELRHDGFVYSCPACEDTPRGREKEAKRARMLDLDQELADPLSSRKPDWHRVYKLPRRLAIS
ncbi:hypothetical protein NX059_002498 [Plenodomus lindquistii]|nr:hypothetical protein NX059_002498 [Plenodomus lindquistii]